MKKFFIQLGAVLLVALALQLFQGSIPSSPRASAAVDELRGWAWSSNIGWVSMNCADAGAGGCGSSSYRVLVNPSTGGLSGYAWSSNVGWIHFSPTGPYPTAGPNWSARIYNPSQPSSSLSGWARALSYNVPNGEWDGWINMRGAAGCGPYGGVCVSGSQFSGFAWGGDVVGWLSFCDDINSPKLYCVTRSGGLSPACPTFTANPSTIIITLGGSGETTLSWQCVDVNPGSCSIDQGVGPVPDSGSRPGVELSYTTTFTLSCVSGGGARAQTFVEVKVFTPTREEIRP